MTARATLDHPTASPPASLAEIEGALATIDTQLRSRRNELADLEIRESDLVRRVGRAEVDGGDKAGGPAAKALAEGRQRSEALQAAIAELETRRAPLEAARGPARLAEATAAAVLADGQALADVEALHKAVIGFMERFGPLIDNAHRSDRAARGAELRMAAVGGESPVTTRREQEGHLRYPRLSEIAHTLRQYRADPGGR